MFGLIELVAVLCSAISMLVFYYDIGHLATVCSALFAVLAIFTIVFVCASTFLCVVNFCRTTTKNNLYSAHADGGELLLNTAAETDAGNYPGNHVGNGATSVAAASTAAITRPTNVIAEERFCPQKCQTQRAMGTSCCSILSLVLAILAALLHFGLVGDKRGPTLVAGLDHSVTATIDANGMLHVVGETHHDVHFAQGLLTTELRLWEMEFQRRVGRGTLSELVGTGGLGHDKMSRTLGLYQAAERAYHDLDNYGKNAVKAYTAGVNAYLRTNATLPFEMILLGVDPYNIDPWVPADSLVWGKIMSLELSGNMKVEWMRYTLLAGANLTYSQMNQILPPFSTSKFPTVLTKNDLNTTSLRDHLHVVDAAAAVPSAEALAFYNSYRGSASVPPPTSIKQTNKEKNTNKNKKKASTTKKVRLLRSIGFHGASNNWVVSGSRTDTGKPMLANDPHLQLTAPSVWLAAHLKVEPKTISTHHGISNLKQNEVPMDVWGASFAGLPGIVTGRNKYISWGVTNTGVDVQDLFVMEEDEKRQNQYKWHGTWIDYKIRKETIRIKNEQDVVIDVRESRTGVVVTDNGVAEQLGLSHDMNEGIKQSLALRWVSTDSTIADVSMSCFLKINLATNFDEYRDALRDYVAPAQNFIFADVNGNIGYQMPGFVPRRSNGHTGKIPIAGDGRYSWKTTDGSWNGTLDKIEFDHMPRAYNPKKGYFASANNRVVPPLDAKTSQDPFAKEGWVLSHDWDGSNMGYRSKRITEMIETWTEIDSINSVQNSSTKKLNMTGLRNMQQDYKSGLWEDFSPYLSILLARAHDFDLSDKSKAWIPKLIDAKTFNGIMSIGSIEPTIFQKWLLNILTLVSRVPITTNTDRSVFLPQRMFNVIWVLDAMNNGNVACGGKGTVDDCLQFAATQLNDAVEKYAVEVGDKSDTTSNSGKTSVPRWGIDVHRAMFEHQVRLLCVVPGDLSFHYCVYCAYCVYCSLTLFLFFFFYALFFFFLSDCLFCCWWNQILHPTPLACLGDRQVEHGGDDSTVNVGHVGDDDEMTQTLGPSYRHLVDLSAPDANSLFLNPLGQSGDMFSFLYDNLLEMWSVGEYMNMGKYDENRNVNGNDVRVISNLG